MGADKGEPNKYIRMEVSKLSAVFTGTGDLFTSIFLAWYDHYPGDIKKSCECTMTSLQQILTKTMLHANNLAGTGNLVTPAQIELRLVDSVDIIRTPNDIIKAEVIQL